MSESSDHDLLIRLSESMVSLTENVSRLADELTEANRLVREHIAAPTHQATKILLDEHEEAVSRLQRAVDTMELDVATLKANWTTVKLGAWVVGPIMAAVLVALIRHVMGG